jgi:hypothetical protein
MRVQDLAPYLRLAVGLRHYVRTPRDFTSGSRNVSRRLEEREANLIRTFERYVYGYPGSPYLQLLRAAGLELGDVARLVQREGVEDALTILADHGVYASVAEFKGKEPMVRGSDRFPVAEADYDNPYLAHDLEVQSGGTRSAGTRVPVKLEFTAALADDTAVLFDAHDLWRHDQAIWLPFGGGASVALLIYAKLGRVPVKWFSHVSGKELNPRFRWGARFLAAWGRLVGARLPVPEFAPISAAPVVARWIADRVRQGRPPCITTYASSAVRAATAAVEQGLDLTGAAFITIGEPLTDAKREKIEASGAKAVVRYAITEAGIIGYGCASPDGPDDLHLLRSNLAMIQRRMPIRGGEVEVDGLMLTSLLPSAPKILINVATGDYATMETRACADTFGRLGYHVHLSDVRSFEKLTGEGVTFARTSLIYVLETVLPSKFGGQPTDYQLVEQETGGGLTRLHLMVNPAVGAIDEGALKRSFLESVGWGDGAMKMGSVLWDQADTLEIRRAAPISTKMGKVQPFHLERRLSS